MKTNVNLTTNVSVELNCKDANVVASVIEDAKKLESFGYYLSDGNTRLVLNFVGIHRPLAAVEIAHRFCGSSPDADVVSVSIQPFAGAR